MAVTKTNALPQQQVTLGTIKGVIRDIALAANDYVTGGISFADQHPFSELLGAVPIGQSGNGAGYHVVVDIANEKVRFFEEESVAAGGPLLEVANGAGVAVTVRLLILGY
jgi:hypothetical protein